MRLRLFFAILHGIFVVNCDFSNLLRLLSIICSEITNLMHRHTELKRYSKHQCYYYETVKYLLPPIESSNFFKSNRVMALCLE